MRFRIQARPQSSSLERVETFSSITFDVGVEQADGSIDSMVVGGSFSHSEVSAGDDGAG